MPWSTRGTLAAPVGHAESPIADQYALGLAGEEIATDWYAQHGYEVLQRRVRCRAGEIDAVLRAPDGDVVFLEVKSRRNGDFGGAEAVTDRKYATMRRCAAEWLERTPGLGYAAVRFDVCEVIIDAARYTATRYEGVEDGAC